MWYIVDLQTLCFQKHDDRHALSFDGKAEAEAWHKANQTCREPCYVEIHAGAANRASVASKLKQLAEKHGGYDVLQSALDYLRA
jgi:hypothetical protein